MLSLFKSRNLALFALYFTSLFSLQFTFENAGGDGLNVPVNISVWFSICLFMLFSLWHMAKQREIITNKLLLIILFSASLLFIPLFYTETRFLEINTLRFVGLFGGVLFYFCLLQLKLQRKEFIYLACTALLGITMQSIYGIVQYYIFDTTNMDGYDAVINRPYGSIAQYNVYATVLVIGTAIGLILTSIFKQRNWKLYLVWLALFIITIPILPTLSRIGLVNFIIVFSIFVALFFSLRKKVYAKNILVGLIVVVLGASLHFVLKPEYTKGKSNSEVVQEDTSSGLKVLRTTRVGTRTTIFPVSYELFKQEPLKGHGIGRFRVKYLEEQAKFIQEHQSKLPEGSRVPSEFFLHHPHNELLFWAIESGIMGVMFLLLPGVAVLFYLLKHKSRYKYISLTLLLPILLHSMTEYPVYLSNYLWFCLFFFILLIDASKKYSLKIHRVIAWLIMLIIVPATTYAVHYLELNMVAAKSYVLHTKTNKESSYFLKDIPRVEAFEDRFEHEVIHLRLRKLNEQNNLNADFVRTYIYWAYSKVQSAPTPDIYYNLVEALIMFKEFPKAFEISNKAHFLFPYDESLSEQNERLDTALKQAGMLEQHDKE